MELKDYTENVYGFWDYKIRCKTCRACMDSPSTAEITAYDGYIRQKRNDETKAKAKRELIINWNRRADNEKKEETAEKYFSPEDVRKMSQSEVRDNYKAIMESMKEWN